MRTIAAIAFDAIETCLSLSAIGPHLREVDVFVSVDEVRHFKPAREVYALAASRLGEALVAAHDWDVQGAKAAGLRAGFVRRGGAKMPALMHAADAAGGSLPEVVGALLKL